MQNYSKLSAACYDIWFPEKEYEDTNFYKRYIECNGQPALEIGCGTGRLLIYYKSCGLDIEGVDSSPAMIEICKKKAQDKGLEVVLYKQKMQQLDLKKKYRTIFIPWGSFMLVSDKQEALQALRKFYEHLLPGGTLLVDLFMPTQHDIHVEPPQKGQWRLRRKGVRQEDGAIIRCWEKVEFLEKEQLELGEYYYEILLNGKKVHEEKEQLSLRWYSQKQFHSMLKEAGFKQIHILAEYSDKPATKNDLSFMFVSKRNK